MGILRYASALALVASACTDGPTLGSGSVELHLKLPPKGDLRPEGMTTVGVGVIQADGTQTVSTTPLEGATFTAGDVQIGDPITFAVELRDNTNRLVGFGRVDDPITPDQSATGVDIPVRKPFVYVAGAGAIRTIDSSVDSSSAAYQGALTAPAATLAVPIDGEQIAVFTGAGLQKVSTTDHLPTGDVIALGGAAIDAAAVPGTKQIVVATSAGISIVDTDSGDVDAHPLAQRPDKVAIGGSATDGVVAYVLSSRAAPPIGATGACSGSSTVFSVPLTAGSEVSANIAQGVPISDIAASGTAVYGANPCNGTVARLDSGQPGLSMQVPAASALALLDGRLYATGSVRSATAGAHVVLSSIQLDGSAMASVSLPVKTEIMTYDLDTAHELAIDMHADSENVLDFAVLPTAGYAALLARMDTHRNARSDSFGEVIPAMDATVYDLVIADINTGGIVQRVREKCSLTVTSNGAEFPSWSCITATGAEVPEGGETVPAAISALYGAR